MAIPLLETLLRQYTGPVDSYTVVATLPDRAALPARAVYAGMRVYVVSETESYEYRGTDATNNAANWVSVGQGPAGPAGVQGVQGLYAVELFMNAATIPTMSPVATYNGGDVTNVNSYTNLNGWSPIITQPPTGQETYFSRAIYNPDGETLSAWSTPVEAGAQGPAGPAGPTGPRGTRRYNTLTEIVAGDGESIAAFPGIRNNDEILISQGTSAGLLFTVTNVDTTAQTATFTTIGNLRGPQGTPGTDADATGITILETNDPNSPITDTLRLRFQGEGINIFREMVDVDGTQTAQTVVSFVGGNPATITNVMLTTSVVVNSLGTHTLSVTPSWTVQPGATFTTATIIGPNGYSVTLTNGQSGDLVTIGDITFTASSEFTYTLTVIGVTEAHDPVNETATVTFRASLTPPSGLELTTTATGFNFTPRVNGDNFNFERGDTGTIALSANTPTAGSYTAGTQTFSYQVYGGTQTTGNSITVGLVPNTFTTQPGVRAMVSQPFTIAGGTTITLRDTVDYNMDRSLRWGYMPENFTGFTQDANTMTGIYNFDIFQMTERNIRFGWEARTNPGNVNDFSVRTNNDIAFTAAPRGENRRWFIILPADVTPSRIVSVQFQPDDLIGGIPPLLTRTVVGQYAVYLSVPRATITQTYRIII